jgi:hypothetical protein
MTVAQLNQRLRWLVLERQAIRDRGAATDDFERNRNDLVRVQWRLAYASVGPDSPDRVA